MPTSSELANVRDWLNAIGSICLADYFAKLAPEYPVFSIVVANEHRGQAAQEALLSMQSATKTQQGAAVLKALELFDGGRLDPYRSRYASYILGLLKKKGHGQVLNRDELMQKLHGVEYLCPEKFRLELEWVVILLAALVHNGDVVLAIPGKKFDAGSMEDLFATPLDGLLRFTHLEQSTEWNLPALKALFELLELTPGMALLITQNMEEPVQAMKSAVAQTLEKIVLAQPHLQTGLSFFGRSLLTEDEEKVLSSQLIQIKNFLESLAAYSSSTKLKNFRYGIAEVNAQTAALDMLRKMAALQEIVAELGPTAAYLVQAEIALLENHHWCKQMQQARHEVVQEVRLAFTQEYRAPDRQKIIRKLNGLKRDYIAAYITLHAEARLDSNQDKCKTALLQDERLVQLQKLASIEVMPTTQLIDFHQRLGELKSCFGLTEQDLQAAPLCPHCNYKPSAENLAAAAGSLLAEMDDELDQLLAEWTKTLLSNFTDPEIRENLKLLKPASRQMMQNFIQSKILPKELSHDFMQALQEVLSGLSKIVVKMEDLRLVLLAGGAPVEAEEMKKRFDSYLGELAKGKDVRKVRIVLE
jgi:hypothetical protein